MQKIGRYILVVIFIVLIISGCSAKDNTAHTALPSMFESDFSANVGRLEISGHITRNETGIYTLTITKPETIAGLEINCVGENVTISIGEAKFETQTSLYPANNFVKSVVNAIDTLCKNNSVSVTRTDGFNRYEAISQSSTFYALAEQDTGNIVSLVIESADISMNFTNFKHN